MVAYEDDADAIMPEHDRPVRITAITLRPRIVVAAGSDLERVRRLVAKAHDECYVANTLTAAITIEPVIEQAGQPGS